MLSALLSVVLIAGTPSEACIAAAHRLSGFLVEEAKGTRHEAQIRAAAEKAGGMDKRVVEIAQGMGEAECAFLLTAPDSAVRALAISALPERNGQ